MYSREEFLYRELKEISRLLSNDSIKAAKTVIRQTLLGYEDWVEREEENLKLDREYSPQIDKT